MKKTYNAPAARAIKMEAQEMIAESIGLSSDAADASYVGGGDAKEDIFGGKSLWDKEW